MRGFRCVMCIDFFCFFSTFKFFLDYLWFWNIKCFISCMTFKRQLLTRIRELIRTTRVRLKYKSNAFSTVSYIYHELRTQIRKIFELFNYIWMMTLLWWKSNLVSNHYLSSAAVCCCNVFIFFSTLITNFIKGLWKIFKD